MNQIQISFICSFCAHILLLLLVASPFSFARMKVVPLGKRTVAQIDFQPTVIEEITIASSESAIKAVRKKKKKKRIKKKKKLGTKDGRRLSEKERYFYELSLYIEQSALENYPSQALKLRLEGVTMLTLTIDRKGRLLNPRLVESSGYEMLDQSAIQLILNLKQFKSLPESVEVDYIELELPVRYEVR